ncbi:patatin-like phospholipase family protein [Paenibacillus contaminans]|uniref:Patatin-like phospholipase family protein n=1 Tax=Paenibacillus contaminans TaxID=450362 RepID=A0A329LMQ4_9BACL|nr:patatin-like phospholipase family protein [Paenibacillus contaminans]RAV09184.1 patatin-like phospholipase family protein [Paenibacillus contaminans]
MTAIHTATLGLALEGGGAKGAYHMGVVKAYLESGHTFGAVAGTSIGALNGAFIAQGDFEAGYRMWESIDALSIFDIDEAEYRQLLQWNLDKSTLWKMAAKTKKFIVNRGMDTSKIRKLIATVVNERLLRDSATDFGLVTVSLTDRLPLELFKEDIPQGQLLDYLIASASFPGFQPAEIDDKLFIDGGLYDNCPINMVARKGYKHIVAVRTLGLGITRQIKYSGVTVTEIVPSENLGGIMNFNRLLIRRNLQMGYYDAQRHIHGLLGLKYYFYSESLNEQKCLHLINAIPDKTIYSLGRMLGIGGLPPRELRSAQIVEKLTKRMRLPDKVSMQTFLIRLAETLAEAKGMNKYTVYTFDDFIRAVRVGPLKNTAGFGVRQVEICMAAQAIFDAVGRG